MTNDNTLRLLSHVAVEEAIRALGTLKLRPRADSTLRVFLAFRALRRDKDPGYEAVGPDLQQIVEQLFQLLEGPKEFPGTLALRGSGGFPNWLTNDSYRGSWMDYSGPSNPGRVLFENEDWRKPLVDDASRIVADAKGPADTWPPRDVLAAVITRNELFDPAATWADVIARAIEKLDVTSDELEQLTSEPALADYAPFEGEAWNPANLAGELRPASGSTVKQSEATLEELPAHTRDDVSRVLDALRTHGKTSIVALAGVPGTSKSYIARKAARAFASAGCLREIQFSPGYTYEEFVEGPRFQENGELEIIGGVFLDFNELATASPEKQFVLLIEELSRADLPKVLGELLTYVEYRDVDDAFTTMYRRSETTHVAPNLAFLATYNPADRSAVSIDAAVIRRLRILSFPPSTSLLREMLTDNGVDDRVIDELVRLFDACREASTAERFDEVMPFGHGVFSEIFAEEDLYDLWWQRLRHMLMRPKLPQHELYDVIKDHYPWHVAPEFRLLDEQLASGQSDESDAGVNGETNATEADS